MASPENYNQMLSKLGKWTFLTTLIFLISLRFFGLIPKIEVNNALVPPIKDYQQLLEWCLSFGAIPLMGAGVAWLLSSFFEVHNKLSKLIQLRYVWDKFFIVRPMLRKVDLEEQLTRKRVKEIMERLYYPEVKNIDQHYVHIFWRYALQFWIAFEHLLVVLAAVSTLYFLNDSLPHYGLFLYLGVVFLVVITHWLFVVTNKSKDQADQIPEKAIRSFMRR